MDAAEDVAEELAENVSEIAERRWIKAAETALQPAVSVTVIARALFRVAQYAVCLGRFLEFFLGFLVARILVGVVFKRQFPVGAFKLLVGGIL